MLVKFCQGSLFGHHRRVHEMVHVKFNENQFLSRFGLKLFFTSTAAPSLSHRSRGETPRLTSVLVFSCDLYTHRYARRHTHTTAGNSVDKGCYHKPEFIQALQKAQVGKCTSSRCQPVIQLCKHQTSVLKTNQAFMHSC